MSEGLREHTDQYQHAIQDPELIRRRQRMIEDGKRDIATQISVAETKARLEAIHEDNRRMAKLMKADGMDAARIAKYTGLTMSEIEELE